MIISNLCTVAGLVNGARGTILAVVLKDSRRREDVQGAISATDVKYVVMDVPKYCGPVIFPGHPTWVPIEPVSVRHDRNKGLERVQLPLVLAWGMTIHKSQGLTFPDGCVVDFRHAPNWQPVANVGMAFVAMSRAMFWQTQAFRELPDFWDFRKVLNQDLFKWRKAAEEEFDRRHDATMARVLQETGQRYDVETDFALHKAWSHAQKNQPLTQDEERDVREMLKVRGVLPAPDYPAPPVQDRRAPQGGGGRKRAMGMRAPAPKKKGRKGSGPEEDEEMPQVLWDEGLGCGPEEDEEMPQALWDEALADAGGDGFPDPSDLQDLECGGGFDDGQTEFERFDFGGLDDDPEDERDIGPFAGTARLDPQGMDGEGQGVPDAPPAECSLCTTMPCACHLRRMPEEAVECLACGVPGCWAARRTCPFRKHGGREAHKDAEMGDHVPHFGQRLVKFQGGTVEIDGILYQRGKATGVSNNCLIDTLRQLLEFSDDASLCHEVREKLRRKYSAPGLSFVGRQTYLILDLHWQDVVRYWAEVTGKDVNPEGITVVCVTAEHGQENGMVEGSGPRLVNVLNLGNNHFDPLLPFV